MTFEQCQSALASISRKQGTNRPLVRVDFAGSIYRGRLARSDSDPAFREDHSSPFGVLVLEEPGLGGPPETLVQIADIPEDGLKSIYE